LLFETLLILSFLIYFNNVITLSTQLININSYSNLEHTSVNNTFNQGEIVYINFYDNISFSILEISIGDKYLLLNNELTSIGLYNQLKINGNEFQFQVNIGNSSDDLVNNTGYYEIFIVLESNSRAKKTYISSLYLLFSNIAQKSSPPPTKKSPSPSFNMQLFGLFSLGVVIPIILYFIYSKNKKRIEINPV